MPKRYVLNAFYHEEHHQLIVHFLDIPNPEDIQKAHVVIIPFRADNSDDALELLKTMYSETDRPAYKDYPYGLAVREVQRLDASLRNRNLTMEALIEASLRLTRYMSVVSAWKHDRKN